MWAPCLPQPTRADDDEVTIAVIQCSGMHPRFILPLHCRCQDLFFRLVPPAERKQGAYFSRRAWKMENKYQEHDVGNSLPAVVMRDLRLIIHGQRYDLNAYQTA